MKLLTILAATCALATPALAGVKETLDRHILPGFDHFAEATGEFSTQAGENCLPASLRPAYQATYDAWMPVADLRLAGVRNIDISCVCPDGIWTPMLHDKLDDPQAALSFSGVLLQPEDVVKAVGTVLDKPRPVTAIPHWRGALARLGAAFPSLGSAALPLLVTQGRRVQKKMVEKNGPTLR